MADATLSRGPDNQKVKELQIKSQRLFLNCNRLKIIDLSDRANQPLTDAEQQQFLLFNGEIYNYQDLKNDLIREGCSFKTQSDTEVLFRLMQKNPQATLRQIQGMFAILFIDLLEGKIVGAKDSRGMKPLFYFNNDDYLIISSSIMGILASGLVEKKLNQRQIPHFLKFRFAEKPQTFYKDIFEVPQGHSFEASIHACNEIKVSAFHTSERQVEEDYDKDHLRDLLTESVLRHYQADVPVGLMLSGGVDSTMLLQTCKDAGVPLPSTFSIVLDEKNKKYGTRDTFYSRLVADRFKTNHTEIVVDERSLGEIEPIVDIMEQPIGDSAVFLTHYLCKMASEDVKVLWSGAGADELFAGYNRHEAFYSYLRNRSHFHRAKKYLQPSFSRISLSSNFPFSKSIFQIKKFLSSLEEDPKETYLNFAGSYHPENFHLQSYNWNCTDEREFLECNLKNALEWDLNNYLISDVLALNDRASMHSGVEMRMPYLDAPLVRYVSNISAVNRIEKGKKWMLKQRLIDCNLKQVANREKEGFGLPMSSWIHKKELDYLWEFMHSPNELIFNFISASEIKRLYREHINHKNDHSMLLTALLILIFWLRKNF